MESSGRTLVCSVLFLDIVEYSKKPVSEQLQLKQEFNRVLTKSLEPVPARDRIILDTGDGINVAQRVMSFARPGQLLVSRSFYEVVSCLSRDYASLFHHEGARTDKHVREHDVYSVVGGTPASRRLADTMTQSLDGQAPGGWH